MVKYVGYGWFDTPYLKPLAGCPQEYLGRPMRPETPSEIRLVPHSARYVGSDTSGGDASDNHDIPNAIAPVQWRTHFWSKSMIVKQTTFPHCYQMPDSVNGLVPLLFHSHWWFWWFNLKFLSFPDLLSSAALRRQTSSLAVSRGFTGNSSWHPGHQAANQAAKVPRKVQSLHFFWLGHQGSLLRSQWVGKDWMGAGGALGV